MVKSVATDLWAALMPVYCVTWREQVARIAAEAEPRRARADYNTGSILEEEAYLLCALAHVTKARQVIEVGTFIGTSTLALALGADVQTVFTCDSSNDCLPPSAKVRTYPKTVSTEMLRDLRTRGVLADLCFFDGALSQDDAEILQQVTYPGTVYAFHDYNYGPKIRKHGLETVPRKGIGNVNLLRRWLPSHVLAEPKPGTSLALLVPEHRL